MYVFLDYRIKNAFVLEAITSGRSEVGGRSPRDLADRTELRIFSPTLDKSIPPPRNQKAETMKKILENLETLAQIAIIAGGRVSCISIARYRIGRLKPHYLKLVREIG